MKPPAPVMTIRSFFFIGASFSTIRLVCSIFLVVARRVRPALCGQKHLTVLKSISITALDDNTGMIFARISSTAALEKLKSFAMTKPTLLVLAAGMGSRYGGLKQIDPVGPSGETIIDYSIYDAMRAGFGKLVFVIRKDIEQQFREIVGSRFEKRIAVEYVFQELDKLPPGHSLPSGRTKPWGTTHAILME